MGRQGGRSMVLFGLNAQTLSRTVVLILLIHVGYLYFMVLFPAGEDNVSSLPVRTFSQSRIGRISQVDQKKHRLVNRMIHEYDPIVKKEMETLVKAKVSADNPRLLNLIHHLLDPPSDHIVKTARAITHTPQSTEAINILEGKQNGFFVECGALDGERSSNTLYLEQKMNWNGLLVEMDPYFYTQLIGKSRKAWSINACLSPYDHPSIMEFRESSGGSGTLLDENSDKEDRQGVIRTVPCFPFRSLMLALNQSQVDFFSLDVEGFELEILKTVPFKDIEIRVLAVEYAHGKSGKDGYRIFMEQQGYSVYSDIHFHDFKSALFVDDFIFIKNSLVET